MRATTVIGLVLLAVIAAATVWNAAESHYRACVEERFASEITHVPSGTFGFADPDAATPAAQLSTVSTKGCSRWPL